MKSVCRLLSLQEMLMKKQDILDSTLKNGISVSRAVKSNVKNGFKAVPAQRSAGVIKSFKGKEMRV